MNSSKNSQETPNVGISEKHFGCSWSYISSQIIQKLLGVPNGGTSKNNIYEASLLIEKTIIDHRQKNIKTYAENM